MTDVNPEIESTTPEIDPIDDLLSPLGKDCSFCGTEHEEEDWGPMGWIGILPISLCPMCEAGIFNMVYQLTPIENFRDLIEERYAELLKSPEVDTVNPDKIHYD